MWLKGTNPQVPSRLGAAESCGFTVHSAAHLSCGDASDPACLPCQSRIFSSTLPLSLGASGSLQIPPSPQGLDDRTQSQEPPGGWPRGPRGLTFPCIGHCHARVPTENREQPSRSLATHKGLGSEDSDGNIMVPASCVTMGRSQHPLSLGLSFVKGGHQ